MKRTATTPPEKLAKELEKKDPHLLELGHIHFFYRPKVDIEKATKLDDVQKLFILLVPHKADSRPRLIIVPKKTLPQMHSHGKTFAFVDIVSGNIDEVVERLSEKTYETKTKGERHQPKARVLATGVYGVFDHNAHSHLAYVLDFPEEITDLHEQFHIEHEGSYVVSVKNPETGLNFLKKKEGRLPFKYPRDLQMMFNDKKWIPLNPDLLNFHGAELLLIGHEPAKISDKIEELAEIAEAEVECTTPKQIFKQIHIDKLKLPQDPMKGKMV